MRKPLSFVAGAALAFGALGGCTGKTPDDNDPTSSGSPSKSGATATAASDQSALVFKASKPPAVQGKADGTINDSYGRSYPGTLNVGEVLATKTGTRLTFWFTGPEQILTDNGTYSWEYIPQLIDATGKQIYDTVIYTKGKRSYCVCSDRAALRAEPQPRTALFAPLPESVTSIQVRKKGFPNITVPVTRK